MTRRDRTDAGAARRSTLPVAALGATLVLLAGCGVSSPQPSAPTHGDVPSSSPEVVDGLFTLELSLQAPSPTAAEPKEPALLRGSDDWKLTRPALGDQIDAFATRVSGPPGTRVGLKVSTSSRTYRVAAYRIGAYRGGWGHLVWKSPVISGRQQPGPILDPVETLTVVAPWRRDLTIDTARWPSGYYVLKLRTGDGWETQVPYIVSSPTAAGTVALVAPVTTWQAYNQWGGYSLYAGPEDGDRRSWAVSFDRPYQGPPGANDYRIAALPIVVRAERTRVSLSYFANIDLHGDPELLAGARGYLSLGHDEYWTSQMRRAVLKARDRGTNLGFLGANTMYWRIRLSDRPSGPFRLLTGYRHDAYLDPLRDTHPRNATSRFRDDPAARPENDLTGMLYECYPVNADYRVVSPGWFGFAGTGVKHGDRIPRLVGPESDRVYPNARTPRPLQILSHITIDCRGAATTSQSTYYSSASGAGVFTAGTLRWGCAHIDACERPLGKRTRDFVRTVTGNLVRTYAAGPAGLRHPAKDNVAAFDLPLLNSVDAS